MAPAPQLASVLTVVPGRELGDGPYPGLAASLVALAREVTTSGIPQEVERAIDGGPRLRLIATPIGPLSLAETALCVVEVPNPRDDRDRLNRIVDGIPHQLALLDSSGKIVTTNRTWRETAMGHGATTEQAGAIGLNYLEACEPDPAQPPARVATADHGDASIEEIRAGLAQLVAGERDSLEVEYPCHSHDEERWYLMHAARIASPPEVVVTHFDITRRKRAELRLRELADHDPLTGLLNRRGLAVALEREAQRARRQGHACAAVLMDCDDFKTVNAIHGHAVGDALLTAIATRTARALRPYDVLGRVGGDEFILLLPELSAPQAAKAAERVRRTVAGTPFELKGARLNHSVSMAVVALDPRASSIEAILRDAHGALLRAKTTTKNCVVTA
ncbi:diguanylate cyclase [Engelhardtia mirabilis]